MTIFVTDVQRLISEAGGFAPPGTKLKNYFWRLCEDLVMSVDYEVQPRTLEMAWREGKLSERLRNALEKLAIQRAHNAEFQLVTDFENALISARADPAATEAERLVATQTLTNLDAIRECMVRRHRSNAVARCYALLESIERDAASEAAE